MFGCFHCTKKSHCFFQHSANILHHRIYILSFSLNTSSHFSFIHLAELKLVRQCPYLITYSINNKTKDSCIYVLELLIIVVFYLSIERRNKIRDKYLFLFVSDLIEPITPLDYFYCTHLYNAVTRRFLQQKRHKECIYYIYNIMCIMELIIWSAQIRRQILLM